MVWFNFQIGWGGGHVDHNLNYGGIPSYSGGQICLGASQSFNGSHDRKSLLSTAWARIKIVLGPSLFSTVARLWCFWPWMCLYESTSPVGTKHEFSVPAFGCVPCVKKSDWHGPSTGSLKPKKKKKKDRTFFANKTYGKWCPWIGLKNDVIRLVVSTGVRINGCIFWLVFSKSSDVIRLQMQSHGSPEAPPPPTTASNCDAVPHPP